MTVRARWLPWCRRVIAAIGAVFYYHHRRPSQRFMRLVCGRATQTTGTYLFGSELKDVLQAQACRVPGTRFGCSKLSEETSRDAVLAALSTNE